MTALHMQPESKDTREARTAPTIGYSCWGFLGEGITETPDGGRATRAPFIRELLRAGFHVTLLQEDRDTSEGGQRVALGQQYSTGFPSIDLLLLEWRWRIRGRNTNPTDHGFTPDWVRQCDLIRHYHERCPILLWDKDQMLHRAPAAIKKLLMKGRTHVLQPSLLAAREGHTSGLFPFAAIRNVEDIPPAIVRSNSIVYIGNDYGRRMHFRKWLVPAARTHDVAVLGKWAQPIRPDLIAYKGRTAYQKVDGVYRAAVATVLLAPRRYRLSGQFTQRIYEATRAGCAPLGPIDCVGVEEVVEPELVVRTPSDVAERVDWLRGLSAARWVSLFERQADRLGRLFAPAVMVKRVEQAICEDLPRYGHAAQPKRRSR